MEKKLTIEHLAAYLPYGLKAINCFNQEVEVMGLQNGSSSVNNGLWIFKNHIECLKGYLYECKPILRSLSHLTQEIEHNGERFVPIDRINGRFRSKIPRNIEVNQSVNNQNMFFVLTEWISFEQLYELFKMLFEWHFDVFGLIDSGLAIEEGGQR